MSWWTAQRSPRRGLKKGFPSWDLEQLSACASFTFLSCKLCQGVREESEDRLEAGFSFQKVPASALHPKMFWEQDSEAESWLEGSLSQVCPHLHGLWSSQSHWRVKEVKILHSIGLSCKKEHCDAGLQMDVTPILLGFPRWH